MALRNAPAAATQNPAVNTAPAFEAEEGDNTVVQTAAPAPAPADAPAASTSTELVEPPKRTVAVIDPTAQKFAEQVAAMEGAADFTWGNYKVFKGNNGELSCNESGEKLGRWVKVTMFAWGRHYEVSPNSKSEKSKGALAFSKDGKTVDRIVDSVKFAEWINRPVSDYVKFLQQEEDYPEANSRQFIDIGCLIEEADAGDDMVGEIIQVTLSQSSLPSFSRYQETLLQKAKLAARGIKAVKVPTDPFTFYFLREVVSDKGNTWTKLAVLDKLPSKL